MRSRRIERPLFAARDLSCFRGETVLTVLYHCGLRQSRGITLLVRRRRICQLLATIWASPDRELGEGGGGKPHLWETWLTRFWPDQAPLIVLVFLLVARGGGAVLCKAPLRVDHFARWAGVLFRSGLLHPCKRSHVHAACASSGPWHGRMECVVSDLAAAAPCLCGARWRYDLCRHAVIQSHAPLQSPSDAPGHQGSGTGLVSGMPPTVQRLP